MVTLDTTMRCILTTEQRRQIVDLQAKLISAQSTYCRALIEAKNGAA